MRTTVTPAASGITRTDGKRRIRLWPFARVARRRATFVPGPAAARGSRVVLV
ncbi:hypothetical protein R2Q81_04145 [Microbacterium aquimaris]|uniref:hypothetical protein n=1 Tax=Microbacterium aquimaris TaxID=459816 RepID=UPI002AD4E942|nr:hypothetical protein [Microbacterium aquimaris]MDZ8275139.1 hypothetical protein [Microbacterium aquimaris]